MAVQINVAANQAALTASIQAGVQAYNQRFAQNNQLNLTVNQRAFSQPLGRMTGDVKDFEAALAASNARVIAFGASTAVLGGVIRSFKELANVTIEVEKSLADINRVFGLTTSQLQKFSADLFSVSKQTASSFDDASKAALEFSRQGLKAEDVLMRTKDALTLTRLAGISTANAVDALTSTVNGFAATGISTTQILNKLVAVEQDYAVGAGDLAEALSRTGQAAQEAGVSLDQLNALVTAAQQNTARGGAVIGNALKTIFTRLQRSETLDQLEDFNIAVRDIQGNTLPAVRILQNFANAYKNLADSQKAQLSEQVAGVYQVNILKAIIGDLNKSQGVYAGALQRGASATNEAEVATAKLNQTLDALLKQTATSTQQLANNIGKVTFEPLAKYGTEQLKSFIESINEILEGEGAGSTFANGLLKGIRNVIAGPGAIAAFFTLFKLIQNSFTYLSQALPQIAGITTETQNRKNIEQSILQIMQQQGPVSQALAGTMGNQAAQAQLLLQIARQQTAEYQMQSTLAKQLAVQLAGQGVRVKGSGGLQVTRAGGYIPNATKMAEVVGAQAGGYAPGRVVSSPVGGVMNTAEDVKYIPGFAQPFINPPAGSKAGRAHRQKAISRTGVDPYMYSGFMPNFAKKIANQFVIGRAFEQSVGIDIGVPPAWNKPIDFKEVLEKPVSKNFDPKLYQSNTFADAHSGLGHKSSENISKVINHLGRNYYSYLPRQGSKTKRLKIDDKTSIISQPDLLGDLFIRPKYTEIIGEGSDDPRKESTSSISSLNDTAKKILLNGVPESDLKRIERRKIKMQFAQDKVYNSGFIPNFAPPTSAIRIPWFKKFGNPAFDAIQPTLGISKASDVDTFRQINFRSTAEGADEKGDSNIFAPLYEDFAFKAMQLVSQPNVKDDLIRGYVLQPGTNQKQSALDAALKEAGIGVEFKGYPKKNLTGSITGELTRKYQSLSKTNPKEAAKLKELIITFNEVGHENQLTSVFGKTFSQLAGTSYSQMLKNSPDLAKGLSAETNSLLNSYVKNPAFLAMAAAKGFIPNFAYKQAVMGLEENMSGNKAIFDTKPFPHIRNSSQPTFSSAIADHGGLGNALSDSMRGQKAAGLMSKGFVPNFADFDIRGTPLQRSASVGGGAVSYNKINKAVNDYIKSIDLSTTSNKQVSDAITKLLPQFNLNQQSFNEVRRAAIEHAKAEKQAAQQITLNTSKNTGRFTKFSENLSKASTAISVAGPLLAGFVEQTVFGNRKRTEMTSGERTTQSILSTGLSAVSTGAGIGASFGPLGAGIGAAAGVLVAFTQSLQASILSVDELKQLRDEEKTKINENLQSAEKYLALQEKISQSTSPKDIKTNLDLLKSELGNITDQEFAKKIQNAGSDLNSLSAVVKNYSDSQKTAKSTLDDLILVQKNYTLQTLKNTPGIKTSGTETGALGKIQVTLSSFLASYGIGKGEKQLAVMDASNEKTRQAIFAGFKNGFEILKKIDANVLVDFQRELSTQLKGNIGPFGSFDTENLQKLLSKGGLSGKESEEILSVFSATADGNNALTNTLAENLSFLTGRYKKEKAEMKESGKNADDAAEAIAMLNEEMRLFAFNSKYAFKEFNRKNEQERKIRDIRSGNDLMMSESFYGKREAARTQKSIDIKNILSETVVKRGALSEKLIETNIQEFYKLNDDQKRKFLEIQKSFKPETPLTNIEKTRNFIKTQFGTIDPLLALDKQKEYLYLLSTIEKDVSEAEKDQANNLEAAAEKLKEALVAMDFSSNFTAQFKAGFRDLANEGEALIGTIGRQIPKMFADGLVDGIKAAIRESDNLGQALMGIAAKFLDEISTMMLRSSIYQIMGSFAPSLLQGSVSSSVIPATKQKGGVIRAQSGMYISGSGTGDKYPALLENGEYVLNRRAVMAMGGPASLDQLNFAMAPRFASGGSFNNEFTDLKSMEANMTSYGMENSKLYGESRDAEVAAAEERRRKAFANKQQRAALIGSLVAAVASIGLAQGMSNVAQNAQSKQAQALSGKLTTGANLTKAESASIKPFIDKGLISPYSGAYTGGSSYSGAKSFFSGPTTYGQSPWFQKMNPFGKQTGGLIGSRLSDTIPGYMEGGLYNTPIVKRYGVGMQAGGASPISNSNSNVVNTTNASNSFNFNTNVNRDGTIEVGSNSTSYAQQDVALSKNLNSKVYAVVLDAIKNEQRFGGSLAGTRQG